MEIAHLGTVTKPAEFNWYYSEPMPVPVLGGKMCRIVVEGYDADPNKDDYHAAIANFLAIDPSVLKAAEPHIFHYYEDCKSDWNDDVVVAAPGEIWRHVHLGSEPLVSRRADGDRGIYVSLECSCDWEEEHGLEIVFKNGEKVTKIGPYDGHLTNSDAYGQDDLENVVYRRVGIAGWEPELDV